jgi:hypothetical protein
MSWTTLQPILSVQNCLGAVLILDVHEDLVDAEEHT